MNIRLDKLKKLKNRYLSGKAAILFLLNRKVAAMTGSRDFGTLTDVQLDRSEKNMVLEITNGLHCNIITITGYGVVNKKGRPHLTWRQAHIEGPDRALYAPVFDHNDGIELTNRYAAVVEAIL